ncbi:MAG TPA: prephenate dehydrogenase/arogenate dehydrogenase family protein, partial [Nannocystis sp.]
MEPFRRVAMLGIGLINGSLAKVLKREGAAGEIVACSRRAETRDRALELGLCDRAVADPADAVRGADLIVLGTPPGALSALAAAMSPGLDRDAIVTDVSSIKAQVVRDVAPHLPDPSRFVPGHPVAGTEHSGPDAAFDTLFVRRRCILTPTEETDPQAVDRVRAMWELAGSAVDVMTPEHHDRVLAITSHLPHLIAYTIV